MRYLLVNKETNIIENAIELDVPEDYSYDTELFNLIASDLQNIGDIYSETPDVPIVPPLNNTQIKEQLAAIDVRKVRAITDAILDGDNTRLQALENECIELRNLLS